ncbi:MAG: HAMP domain-containing protein, partial [Gammaproteobacteria bacterium]|nr:HAMP domain-containing protein [Gammaproteobacteria bacterium]
MRNTAEQTGSTSVTDMAPASGQGWWLQRFRTSGIRARIIFTVTASLIVTILVLGMVVYQTMSVRLIAQQKELLRQDSQFASMQFSTFLQTMRTDTLMLADQVRLSGLDTALSPAYARDWRSLLLSKPAYSGIRVLSADGARLMDIKREDDDLSAAPAGDLVRDQSDAARSLQMEPGMTWISDIERSPDTGRPTFRIITPLAPGPASEAQSCLVISVDIGKVRELLMPASTLSDLYAGETRFFITNGAGEFISHPDRKQTLWHGDSKTWRLQDEFPDKRPGGGDGEDLSILETDNAGGESMLLASTAVRLNPGEPGSVRFMLALPYAAVLDAARPSNIDHVWFAFLMLLIALLANTLTTRTLVQPLRQITTAIREAGTTNTLSSLPVDRQDEIGELAPTFREMFVGRLAAE